MLSTTFKTDQPITAAPLRPLGLRSALLLFLAPALLFRISMYWGLGWLITLGLPPFDAFIVAFIVPLALLLTAALVAAQRELGPLSWAMLRARFRFRRLDRRGWLITAGCFALGFLGSGLFGLTARMLAEVPGFAPPSVFPEVLDPRAPRVITLTTFMGAPLLGNWRLVGLYLLLLVFNIAGEELWWRGYILPRQELVYGARTWLVHGGLWLAFHVVFYPWQLLGLLPLCFALSYAAQRTRSIWPGIIIHSLSNGLAMVPLVIGVLGW